MQLSKNNNNNVDVDVLNDYDWHIADLQQICVFYVSVMSVVFFYVLLLII